MKSKISLHDFRPIQIIGTGGFGIVYLMEKKSNKKLYAMKQLRKDIIIKKRAVNTTRFENKILKKVHHPFLVGMEHCFQTAINIYFVMKFYRGGDLYKHLVARERFSEGLAAFYAAQLVLALGELHKNDIIYRDLKPENVLLGEDGYIAIADFGLAKILEDDNVALTFCGTSEYLAPEIISGEAYDKTVDWWGLGILIHEMITGRPPFRNKNRLFLYKEILGNELKLKSEEIVMSQEAESLVRGLLAKDPKKRLGVQGVEEIKAHPFFRETDFERLLRKEVPVKYVGYKECSALYFKSTIKMQQKNGCLVELIDSISMKIIQDNKNLFDDFF